MAVKIINRYARYEYEILETYEGGIVLVGDEIKAIRSGRANLKGAYGRLFYNNARPEIFLVGAHFHSDTIDPYRTRKLLFKKDEIKRFIGKLQEKNLTLIPLTIYMKRGKAKIELGLGRGKKKYDKRETIKKRDLDREIKTNLKERIK